MLDQRAALILAFVRIRINAGNPDIALLEIFEEMISNAFGGKLSAKGKGPITACSSTGQPEGFEERSTTGRLTIPGAESEWISGTTACVGKCEIVAAMRTPLGATRPLCEVGYSAR